MTNIRRDEPARWQTSGRLWDKLKPKAREMRRIPTEAEDLLWQRLRNRRLSGCRFRRQHTIDRFIVDFYCAEAALAIEIDGDIHMRMMEQDAFRQTCLESQGLRVLRFSNEEVVRDIERVLGQIASAIGSTSPPTPLR